MKIFFCVLLQFALNIGAAESREIHGFFMKQLVKVILSSHLISIQLNWHLTSSHCVMKQTNIPPKMNAYFMIQLKMDESFPAITDLVIILMVPTAGALTPVL